LIQRQFIENNLEAGILLFKIKSKKADTSLSQTSTSLYLERKNPLKVIYDHNSSYNSEASAGIVLGHMMLIEFQLESTISTIIKQIQQSRFFFLLATKKNLVTA
jgi:hypothetical protein